MSHVEVVDEVRASADAVWELVRDFGGITKWSTIESCEVEGEGIGAVRTLGIGGGASIRERLESFDQGSRSFSYSIIDGPLPLENYLSTFQVSERGADRCQIEWGSSFDPVGASEEQVAGILRGVYEGGIAAIKKNLEK